MKVKVKCRYCDSELEKDSWAIKQSQSKGYNVFYCNSKCQAKHKSETFINNFKLTGLIKCGCCANEKHYSEFNKNKNRSIGYGTCCKQCHKYKCKKHYNENKTHIAKIDNIRHNKYLKEKISIIKEYLKNNSCVHCGTKNIKTCSLNYKNLNIRNTDIIKELNNSTHPKRLKVQFDKCQVSCFKCEDKSVQYKKFNIGNNQLVRIVKLI